MWTEIHSRVIANMVCRSDITPNSLNYFLNHDLERGISEPPRKLRTESSLLERKDQSLTILTGKLERKAGELHNQVPGGQGERLGRERPLPTEVALFLLSTSVTMRAHADSAISLRFSDMSFPRKHSLGTACRVPLPSDARKHSLRSWRETLPVVLVTASSHLSPPLQVHGHIKTAASSHFLLPKPGQVSPLPPSGPPTSWVSLTT